MQAIELLGYTASLASGGAFLPQAIRALRTKQTRDLSLVSVWLGAAGTILWATYGFLLHSGHHLVELNCCAICDCYARDEIARDERYSLKVRGWVL